MPRVVTVVLHRDGRHHCTIIDMPPSDARRWADEGMHVFQIACRGDQWAVHVVRTGRVFDDKEQDRPTAETAAPAARALLQFKGGGE